MSGFGKSGSFVLMVALTGGAAADKGQTVDLYTLDTSEIHIDASSTGVAVLGWPGAHLDGFIASPPSRWSEDALAGARGQQEIVPIYRFPRLT